MKGHEGLVKKGVARALVHIRGTIERLRGEALGAPRRVGFRLAYALVDHGGFVEPLPSARGQLQALNRELRARVAQRTQDLEAANRSNELLLQQSRAAETRYRQLFTCATDAVLIVDSAAVIRDANPAASRLLGESERRLVGIPLTEIFTSQLFNSMDTSQHGCGELAARRLDGGIVPVDASVTPLDAPDSAVAFWTLRDISDRRRLAKLQEEFLSMAAHELKTPLTTLKGFAQLLQRGISGNRAADVIVQQADHLNLLVGNLLDVARLESREITIQPVETDLRVVLNRAVDQARALTLTHQIECEPLERPIVGVWDAARLEEVMTNLLSNAVKHAPSSRRITVRVAASDDYVRITVRDFGPGIAAAAMPNLFKRFYRVDNPTRRGVEGMGLGLYISRIIIEAHGGTIQVASQLGQGCAFTFSLPRWRDGRAL